MDPFFLYVSIGALALLIISLVVIGVMLSQMNSYSVFPPLQAACPDHWDVSSNPNYCGAPILANARNLGNIQKTTNTGITKTAPENIGMCTGTTFGCTKSDPTYIDVTAYNGTDTFQYIRLGKDNPKWNSKDGLYPDKTALCAQHKWANLMDISWDGVSNYNGC